MVVAAAPASVDRGIAEVEEGIYRETRGSLEEDGSADLCDGSFPLIATSNTICRYYLNCLFLRN